MNLDTIKMLDSLVDKLVAGGVMGLILGLLLLVVLPRLAHGFIKQFDSITKELRRVRKSVHNNSNLITMLLSYMFQQDKDPEMKQIAMTHIRKLAEEDEDEEEAEPARKRR